MTVALTRRSAVGAALTAPVALATAAEADPIYAAIAAVRAGEAGLTAALKDLDEDDPVQMRRADEACDRSCDARNALSGTLPTTLAGFHALIRFHAEDVAWMEPDTYGALALRDVVAALDAIPPAPS